jgi:hypothetical protein
MAASRTSSRLGIGLAAIGLCLPLGSAAADDVRDLATPVATNASLIRDVELSGGGILIGRLLDADGQPMADAAVSVLANSQVVATARTDRNGVFAVAGLRGGVHEIAAADTVQLCRLWTAGMAPPRAAKSVEIVSETGVVRGQWGPPPGNGVVKQIKVLATNPFVVGGVVAAAVAIPVALSDDDGPNS